MTRDVRVTISGADDSVPHALLVEMSSEFPFVEWGILYSTKRFGQPRYPSREWLDDLRDRAKRFDLSLSLHLCGEAARTMLRGEMQYLVGAEHFDRVQLNGYEPALSTEFKCRVGGKTPFRFILQTKKPEHLSGAIYDALMLQADVLIDASGGEGKHIDLDAWNPELLQFSCLGFAGGLGPDNVRSFLEQSIEKIRVSDSLGARGGTFYGCWIDMESGVRDEKDQFDVGKVARVLEKVKRYRESGPL